jgi:hypothetical protein
MSTLEPEKSPRVVSFGERPSFNKERGWTTSEENEHALIERNEAKRCDGCRYDGSMRSKSKQQFFLMIYCIRLILSSKLNILTFEDGDGNREGGQNPAFAGCPGW